MAERFTGFWETGPSFEEPDGIVLTTIGPLEIDDLLERLRVRLAATEPGVNVRIDLIAW
jgi:hypothetical protein